MSIREEKAALRKLISRKRALLEDVSPSNLAIARQTVALPAYQSARMVFCFVSTPDEIDTFPLLRDLLDKGTGLAVPLCISQGIMEARRIFSLEALRRGRYGILEPAGDAPPVQPADIDLAIVPCLSCDRQCHRLGQGGGYYDRFLRGQAFTAAALCRSSLMLDTIPTEAWDQPVDMVITERQIHRPA